MAGTLIIIGGHEDREGEKLILREVASRAGQQPVVVVTVASKEPEEMFEPYQKAFTDLGVKKVVQVLARQRQDCLDEDAAEPIRGAGAIFFTGGDQLRLTSQLGDTPVFDAIHKRFTEGVVVAGTSAGASVLGETMLVSGESGVSPRSGDAIKMAPGFGLVKDLIIDQHFAKRGRTGRLLAAIAQNPKSLGLGVDEDAAAVLENRRFKVVGSGGIYVFDASGVTYSSVADCPNDELLSIHDAILHVLAPGDVFDLTHRRPVRPSRRGK